MYLVKLMITRDSAEQVGLSISLSIIFKLFYASNCNNQML